MEENGYMYKCTSCDLMYGSFEEINEHVCAGQQLAQLYKCSACSGLYSDLDTFNSHSCVPGASDANEELPVSSPPAQLIDATNLVVTGYHEGEETVDEAAYNQDAAGENGTTPAQSQTIYLQGVLPDIKTENVDKELHPEILNVQSLDLSDIKKESGIIELPSGSSVQKTKPQHPCPCCKWVLLSASALRDHVRAHRNLHQCPICGWQARNERGVLFHHRLVHRGRRVPDARPAPGNFLQLEQSNSIDDLAPFYFDQAKPAVIESYTAAISSKTDCCFCWKKFTNVMDRKKHVHTKHGTLRIRRDCKVYRCDESRCHSKFRSKLGLVFHIRTHLGLHLTKTKCFRCGYCSRRFKDKVKLRQHKLAHFLQFRCSVCAMLFRSMHHLSIHKQRQHKGQLWFECKECNVGFSHKEVLTRHKKHMHRSGRIGAMSPSPYGEDLSTALFFNCSKCYEIYTSEAALTKHWETGHAKKPFVCPKCLASFGSRGAYWAHAKEHHRGIDLRKKTGFLEKIQNEVNSHRENDSIPKISEDKGTGQLIYTCRICNYQFTSQVEYVVHMNSCHGEGKQSIMKLEVENAESEPGIKHEKVVENSTAENSSSQDYCIVTVSQEGEPVPVTKGTVTTRVCNLETPPTSGPWTQKKKLLHKSVFELRGSVEAALSDNITRFQLMPERSHAELFEDVLAVERVQSALDILRGVAAGCSLTLAVPFPDRVHGAVFVHFLMKFGDDNMAAV